MPLHRILETEVMDTPEEALDYDAMDHSAVNRLFVDDLLAALTSSKFKVQSSRLGESKTTLNFEPGTLNSTDSAILIDVLDLGTGTAQIPIELCRRFEHCRVMACDAAASMLEQAAYNLAAVNFNDRIQLKQVDAKALPFHQTRFDVVMSNSIIHHIPEPITVLREAARVARPGGLLFFRDLLRPDSEDERQHLVETYAAGANDHQRQMFADSLHAALALDEIRELVASLGFPRDSVQQTSDRHWTWVATS
ncbi:MAG: class I SAM-dependent methyltransferase [Planctomycetaceae bacterium]|nr:class I SAM-dependent methyltransferase [Planctomycetaceae bacterium]